MLLLLLLRPELHLLDVVVSHFGSAVVDEGNLIAGGWAEDCSRGLARTPPPARFVRKLVYSSVCMYDIYTKYIPSKVCQRQVRQQFNHQEYRTIGYLRKAYFTYRIIRGTCT